MSRRIAVHIVGKTTSYKKAMYRNIVTDLLGYEKITTTEAKARQARGMAEKMITLGKKGGLHSRRQALAVIYDKKITDKVFTDLAKRYAERKGGYTRVTKLGPRPGDGAPMVRLELVE